MHADAGIPHYWIIDLQQDSPRLTACELTENGYRDSGACSGVYTTAEPFPLTIDLDGLTR